MPLMFAAPLPAAVPVIPATEGAAQLKVVPAGTMPSVPFTGLTEKVVALQMVAVWPLTSGTGLTVKVTASLVISDPQFPCTFTVYCLPFRLIAGLVIVREAEVTPLYGATSVNAVVPPTYH